MYLRFAKTRIFYFVKRDESFHTRPKKIWIDIEDHWLLKLFISWRKVTNFGIHFQYSSPSNNLLYSVQYNVYMLYSIENNHYY